MGSDVARLATGLIHYYFAVAEGSSPGSTWTMGNSRSVDGFQAPMLRVPDRGEASYSIVLVAMLRGIERTYGGARHDALRKLMERWLGLDPAWEDQMRRLSEPQPPWRIGLIQHPVFTHGISIRDDIAWSSERRITSLVAALEAEEGIERAVHEDRENILVRAPSLDEAGVEAIVKRLWTRRRKQTA